MYEAHNSVRIFHFLHALLVSYLVSCNALDVHFLRPISDSDLHPADGVSCESWQFGIETNNIRDWEHVPTMCEDYVGHYMLGGHYRADSAVVVAEAINYAEALELVGDGKDVWVFDVDETTLSNLPYYAANGFGVEPYNSTKFKEWLTKSKAPALPESLKLYKKLLSLGIKVIILTGRREPTREATSTNLQKAGFHTWEKLLLKGNDVKTSSLVFKSGERKKLVEQGYRIW
ncbi:putative Acid phosphatase [Dioscorea sansibarensis]